MFDFLTPQIFEALIWGTILIGLVLAGLRLYSDLALPHRPARRSAGSGMRSESLFPDNEPADEPKKES